MIKTGLCPRFIVITSDEHLPPTMGRGAWASRPTIRGDIERAMEFVHDYCEERQEAGVVRFSCADTLDSFEPEPDRLQWMVKYFAKHLAVCQGYFYIQGQHDRVARCPTTPWLSIVSQDPKLQYVHRKHLEISGRQFIFHDNTSPTQLMEFLEQPSEHPVEYATLISHQLWHPWVPANRMAPSIKSIPGHIVRMFSGDYHIQTEATRVVKDDGIILDAWSVGPLTIQDVSEPNNCRFLVIDTTDWSVTSVPVPTRPVEKYEIITEDHLLAFVDRMNRLPTYCNEDSIEKPIVKVKYMSSLEQAHKRISEACYMRAHLFLDPMVAAPMITMESVYSRNSSASDVQQCIDISGKAPRGTLVREILDTALSATSLADMTSKMNELRSSFISKKKGASSAN